MKKALLVLGLLTIFFKTINVYAQELNIEDERISEIYVERDIFGRYSQSQLHKFTINNETGYCIKPGVAFTNGGYTQSNDFDIIDLSTENKQYLETVSYYGYGYEGHNNIYYYMATQQLIWERLGITDIKWKTSMLSYAQTINIDEYLEDINVLVNNHSLLPSFKENSYNSNGEKTLVLEDTNNILKEFELISITNHDINIFDNKLVINFNESTETELLTFKRKISVTNNSSIYLKTGSQTLATLYPSNIPEFNISIKNNIGSINITKFEENTNIPLEDVKFEIYKDNILLNTITTDKEGRGVITSLPYGEYVIKEISTQSDYILDDTEYKIIIDEDNEYITLYNKRKLYQLEINKIDSITKENIKDISEFKIYDINSEEYLNNTFKTDSNGYLLTDYVLKSGKYLLYETKAPYGYKIMSDPIEFVIRPENELLTINVENKELPKILQTNKNSYIQYLYIILILISIGGLCFLKKY